ncbi:AMP-binding protein [Marinobacter sp. F3R11]|uniref:AMP-binding protein n=1 Tax=Marinobacter sp. F3R11 TaxID=2267231 RepID=UPI000DE90866|nr:AMP-binding protein [Marinobacter sp. F3R11]RBW51923.1 AMP-dependent synthetase [Marinobacter sp. F3R11]
MATLPELLKSRAMEHPSRIALREPEAEYSYRQMVQAAETVAAQLESRGIKRVGICGDNTLAWILADLACLFAGVVCVPVPHFFSETQATHLIKRAGLNGLLHSEAASESEPLGHGIWLRTLPTATAAAGMPVDTAKITFTSGSTGTPKGVCLSVEQMTATTLALKERLAGIELQAHLCILPLATLLENIAGVYLPLLMGAAVKVEPLASLGMTGSSGLDLRRLVAGVNRNRPQSLILVPELAMALVGAAEQGQLDSGPLRFLAVGGGRVSSELLSRGRSAGLPLYEGYGLSECCSVVALNVPAAGREGSVGQPLSHVDIRVSSDGHILVRGNTHLGYLGEDLKQDEWLDTGDLGALSTDGFLSVNGRSKNLLITTFGRNISPEWLESELVQGLAIPQAVVFGDGEPQPMALITVTDGRSPSVLAESLRQLNQRLPDYARLATVYVRRQRLNQAEGFITANGRPVRAYIQDHLPTLLVQAFPLFLSAPWTNQPGESRMAFFDRLQQETSEARAHVTGAPVVKAIGEGGFSLESYNWFLAQAFHHVKHTVPLMMACGARLPHRLEFVRKALVEYIDEEYGHDEWILNDLEACGADKEAIRGSKPDLSIELMVAYLYDQISRGNPAAFFGMVQVLEGTSIELATPLGEQIQKLLGLPDQAFSYLYSHGALDQDHFEFFRNLMDGITDPRDQQAVIDSARVVYRLYGDMLHSIPLPGRRQEQSHEAA